MTKAQLTQRLNQDLALEYRSIVQYVQHIACIKGARYQQTLEELGSHLSQELEHAKVLAKQIDFLGGEPNASVPDVDLISEPRAALESDLELEENQLRRYRERVEEATEAGLPDVAEVLTPLLQQTQDHVRDLRSALDV